MDKPQEKQSVIRSAAAMSLGTMGSRVLGLVRDIVLAAFFSRTITDIFVVAFRLPNMFRRLLGEGALAVSFIPVFVELKNQDPEKAKELAGAILGLLWAVAGGLCVLGVIFMEPLMGLLVSGDGFANIPGKLESTVFFARIMFSYLFLVTTYAFCMSVLNALKFFFIPAVAPAFFNLTFICFALLPKEIFGADGLELAWGVIAGGFVQVGVVIFALYKNGYLVRPRWQPQLEKVKLVLRNMVPGLMGMGILQLMGLVNVNYASRLGEGSHSYIYWADRILELPQSLIAISLGTALLPTLSDLWSRGEKDQMRATGQEHMHAALYLILPCSLGMYLLAQPIVEALFQRGNFSIEDSAKTASVVRIYALLLVAAGLYKVTIPNFYAIKNTWLPALTTFFALLFHVVLAHFWVNEFGLEGLVGSMALATLVNLSLVLVAYGHFFGSLNILKLLMSVAHQLPSLILMGMFIMVAYENIVGTLARAFPDAMAQILGLLLTVAAGALVYYQANERFKHPVGLRIHQALLKRVVKK